MRKDISGKPRSSSLWGGGPELCNTLSSRPRCKGCLQRQDNEEGAWQGLVLIVIVSGAKVGRCGKRFCRESDTGDNLGGDCGSDGGGGGGGGGGQTTKLTIL